MIARCDPDLTDALLAASAEVLGSLARQLGGASKSIVSWAVIFRCGLDVQLPAVGLMFEHGEAFLAPASEVVAAAVAKAFDCLQEGVVVVGGRVESGHGVRRSPENLLGAASTFGAGLRECSDRVYPPIRILCIFRKLGFRLLPLPKVALP